MKQGSGALQGAYFRARVRGAAVEIEGQDEALLGHRIELPGEVAAGNWVAWRWDGAVLTVTRDRFGAHPLYYAASADGITVSPSIARILGSGVSRTLDLDALAAFASVGYYLEADTPFRDVRSLTPGATLTWRPGRLEVVGSPPTFEMRPMTRAEMVDGFLETTRAAVARCIAAGGDGEWVMPLSGGRDSRHLLYELIRQGHAPSLCITAGHYPGIGGREDRRKAADLCAVLGIEHRADQGVAVPRGGRAAQEHAHGLRDRRAFLEPVPRRRARRAHRPHLRGVAWRDRSSSDPGSSTVGESSGAPADFDELAHRITLGKYGRDTGRDRYTDLLAPDVRESLSFERATARVRRALAPYEHEPDPVLNFVLWNRGIRELMLTPTVILSAVPSVYTPYLDPGFVSFAMSVPIGGFGRDIHDEVIERVLPDVPPVPYARFGRPVMPRPLARRVHRDLARVLMHDSDGSLVHRRRLLRRTMAGAVTGDPDLALGRRPSLVAYLVQLENVVRDGARPPP